MVFSKDAIYYQIVGVLAKYFGRNCHFYVFLFLPKLEIPFSRILIDKVGLGGRIVC